MGAARHGRFGIVADDLTGAGDTGLQYYRSGLRTWILTHFSPDAPPSVPDDVQAVALNAGSRNLPPDQGARRSADAALWLRNAGCRSLYLKMDSTLRGNPGHEIDRLLMELGYEIAVVAPAFPEAGRITVGGFQLVDGIPVALSLYGQDPQAPVQESHLPTLLAAACGDRVASIDLRVVLEGWEAIAGAIARLRSAGVRVLVADAVRTADLEAIAAAIDRLRDAALPVGSAGLAAALRPRDPSGPGDLPILVAGHGGGAGVRTLGSRTGSAAETAPAATGGAAGAESPPAQSGSAAPAGMRHGRPVGRILGRTAPILIVSGSANPVTFEQIKQLGATARLVLVDVRQLLLTEGGLAGANSPGDDHWGLHQELAMAARQALQGLLAGRDVVVTTALSADQVARDRELGRELGMTGGQVGTALADSLGALAKHLDSLAVLGGVVVAGGETAAAVCLALPCERLEVVEEVLPAVALSRVVGRNLRVVTKSGGFGAPDALRHIVDYLRQTEEVA